MSRADKRFITLFLSLSMFLLASGCGTEETIAPEPDPLLLEFLDNTQVQFDPTVGTTTVVVQFVARNSKGVPLEGEAVEEHSGRFLTRSVLSP